MQTNVERIYYLDSMRSVLMMLGVVLHSAQVFNPDKTWLLFSQNSSQLAYIIVQIIHTFRMPAFFVLSGFFCVITLQKYQFKRFIIIRIQRIIIPIVAVALTFNLMQTLVLSYLGEHSFELSRYFLKAEWVGHLWFLINLTIYLSLTAILYLGLTGKAKCYIRFILGMLEKCPLYIVIICLPIMTIAILALNKIGFPLYERYLSIIDVYSLLKYSPYFLFGLILGLRIDLLRKFSQTSLLINILLLLGGIACLNVIENSTGFHHVIVDAYFTDLVVWISIALIFNLFYTFFNHYSSTWRYLSDASYSVYLFHHFFVVLIGLAIIKFQMPSLIGMLILMLATSIISLGIHKYIVCEIKIFKFIFNGK